MKKKTILLFVLILILSCLSSCGKSLAQRLDQNRIWQTVLDEENSGIRWEFTTSTLTYVNIVQGEDVFSQTFNYETQENTLILQSEYETLKFEIILEDNTLTAKSENGEVIFFNKKQN